MSEDPCGKNITHDTFELDSKNVIKVGVMEWKAVVFDLRFFLNFESTVLATKPATVLKKSN